MVQWEDDVNDAGLLRFIVTNQLYPMVMGPDFFTISMRGDTIGGYIKEDEIQVSAGVKKGPLL